MTKCKVDGCDRCSDSLGMCNMHYQRYIKHGNTDCDNPAKYWTELEIEFLKKKYPSYGCKYVAESLNKSERSVYKKAHRLGVKTKTFFTDKQIEFIERHADYSNERLAKVFNRTVESVRTKRYTMQAGTIIDSQEDKICFAEIGRLVGKHKTTIARFWTKDGLPYVTVGQYKMVTIKDLYKFMEDNPKRWDATKCEDWFFRDQKWFQEKRKEDFKKMQQRRWGEFYEVS